jgi:phospholipid/cholesterol/gamma-HCH transport system ATP-binding protein
MSVQTDSIQTLPPQQPPLIKVSDVTKSFGDRHVLAGVSLEVHANEVVAIIGTSGCGKSTLLRLIAGLEDPDTGTVALNDPNFTLVFQYSALFDSLNVFDNVAFALVERPDDTVIINGQKNTWKKRSPETIRDLVLEKLDLVGLDDVAEKYPNQLSGGMQKRVSFARAIINNPRIILYDEPTAGLDPIASTVIEDYILKLKNDLKAASVVVTHQFSTIQRTADRVYLLHHGLVQWCGTPAELMQSDNPYARQFATASLDGPMG